MYWAIRGAAKSVLDILKVLLKDTIPVYPQAQLLCQPLCSPSEVSQVSKVLHHNISHYNMLMYPRHHPEAVLDTALHWSRFETEAKVSAICVCSHIFIRVREEIERIEQGGC